MTTDGALPPASPVPDRGAVSTRSIVVYTVIAVLLAWVCALPAWFTGGLASPWFTVCAAAMMFAPAVAAVVTLRWVERRPWRTADPDVPGVAAALGTSLGPKAGRLLGWLGIAWLVTVGLVVAGYVTSWLLGTWRPDLTNFSALSAYLSQQGVPMDLLPPLPVFAAAQLVQGVTIGAVVNSIATAGEELGWRGMLYPALLARLPRPLALLVGGVIWGLWHAPVILLGYNYGRPLLGLVLMCGFTVLYGAVLAWLRARSGSVWPAVLGHAVVNALVGGILVTLGDSAHPPDPVWGTPLGLTGWIVPAAVVALLVWRGRWQPSAAAAPSVSPTPRFSPPPDPRRAG